MIARFLAGRAWKTLGWRSKAAKRLRSLGAARSDSMGLDMIIYFPDAGAPSQAWMDSEDA